MRIVGALATLWLALLVVNGCGEDSRRETGAEGEAPTADAPRTGSAKASDRLVRYTEERAPCRDRTPLRQPLFGDLHVHTSFSFDAAANSIGATPTDAHRFARGEAIDFWPLDESGGPTGKFAIDRPLDFLAVTDHGEFLGERALCRTSGSVSYETPFCAGYRADERQGMLMLGQVITTETPARVGEVCGADGGVCLAAAKGPWKRLIEAAEAAYDRSEACSFTSFVGYEYTGTPGVSNYHRNVIFRNAEVPELPVSYIDAPIDRSLWQQLDVACNDRTGCDYLTIPHNTNLANGRMAPYVGLEATVENRRAYAEVRLDREPIVEIFQHKGASECINGLSAVLGAPDELCDVEAVRVLGRKEAFTAMATLDGELVTSEQVLETTECGDQVGANGMVGAGCVDETDFVRSALLVGLQEERAIGLNPIKLGIIASTDTHTATPGAVAEADYRGAVTGEATPQARLERGLLTSGRDGNPGGLAGVWAVENSRDAIFEAMQRREVFGTSGPRITPRFFAGWDYAQDLCDSETLVAEGYARGVPMGGDLEDVPARGARPSFIAFAARDSAEDATPLRELQLVKGWIDGEGALRYAARAIAGADRGADTLCAVVQDETFDTAQSAYYYLRAVEAPTPRWSAYDCQRIEEAVRPPVCSDGSLPETTVEMAWTSPIWYRPEQSIPAE
ncbi:MAG: DUF3604 domain-containing protein [Gammaproteobacteria bacterium]|nr:DUF3604 domain-containing protein [Gammaproteobacteria bacterium]